MIGVTLLAISVLLASCTMVGLGIGTLIDDGRTRADNKRIRANYGALKQGDVLKVELDDGSKYAGSFVALRISHHDTCSVPDTSIELLTRNRVHGTSDSSRLALPLRHIEVFWTRLHSAWWIGTALGFIIDRALILEFTKDKYKEAFWN